MRIPALVAFLALVACSSTKVTRLGPEYPPRQEDWPIAVHVSGDAPESLRSEMQTYIGKPSGRLIARLKVSSSNLNTWVGSVSEAQSEARKLGGDAIYVTGFDRYDRDWASLRSELEVTVYRQGN